MVAPSVITPRRPSSLTVPFRRGPERLAFEASARPHSAGSPPPGPKAVGSMPPGPPSTTKAPVPDVILRMAFLPSGGSSVPTRIQSCLRAFACTSIWSAPSPALSTQSSTLSAVGRAPAKTVSVAASLPPALISLGPVRVGTILRHTDPSEGHGGCAGSSSVIVAPDSASRLLVFVPASGVPGPATSPGGGSAGAVSGRSSSETTARSLPAVPAGPRRPTWVSTAPPPRPSRLTPGVRPPAGGAPPPPGPSPGVGLAPAPGAPAGGGP